MKKLLVSIAIILTLTVAAFAQDQAMTAKAGGYTVNAAFDHTPPIKGINKLTITVKDNSAKVVTDAKVAVEYFMTQRESPTRKFVEMPYMGSQATGVPKKAAYEAPIDLTMNGPWHIDVKVTEAGKTSKASFYVTVK